MMHERRARRPAGAIGLTLALLVCPATASAACGKVSERPWCERSLTPTQRAEHLVAAMSQLEKVNLLGGDDPTGVLSIRHTGISNGVPRLGIPDLHFTDGPVGSRTGPTTAMPIPLALGAGFEPRLARRFGSTIAGEARAKGNEVLYAPTVDLMRTPLAGRTFETFGEDPYLSSALAAPWVKGAQARGVITSVKHFAPNNQEGYGGGRADRARPGDRLVAIGTLVSEGSRMQVNAVVDRRTLHEVYFPPYEAAVRRGGSGSVMCAYNRLNDHHGCESAYLQQHVLRDEWGFDGFVVADYGGVHDTGRSIRNGLDFEPWPSLLYNPASIELALATGEVTQEQIDGHVIAILRTMFRFGFFDDGVFPVTPERIDRRAGERAARTVAENGTVLLKNERGLLPLQASELDSIALIGAGADSYTTGGGSADVTPFHVVTPRDAIAQRLGEELEILHEDGSDRAAAARAADRADVAVVFAPDYTTEGIDRRCPSLQCPPAFGDQDALIEAVAAANPRTIVVLETGAPVLTPWRGRIRALLEAWYPGQEGGHALARILFGEAEPGGRLPATFPRHAADIPTAGDRRQYPGIDDEAVYSEGVFVGYRSYDERGVRPAFEFGFGRSYTTFSITDLDVARGGDGHVALARVRVKNTGNRPGTAVPQLYLGLPSRPGVPQPRRKLAGFEKVGLRPGEAKTVRLPITRRDVSWWQESQARWTPVRGCVKVMAGSSSRRLPLRDELGVGVGCR
jgi:beta-glucosidase